MYGVLGLLLIGMAVSSALDDRKPWSRRVGRYKIELVPNADEEYEPYVMATCNADPSERTYDTTPRSQKLLKLNGKENILSTESPIVRYKNYRTKEQSINTSGRPVAARSLRRCVRPYASWKEMSSPIISFINENFIKAHRRKKRKKKRRNNSEQNLKIYVSNTESNIENSMYVKGIVACSDKSECTCEEQSEETTKIKFILTPCECEGDNEITEQMEHYEEPVQEEVSQEESFCEPCKTTMYETTCNVKKMEPCCKLDPMPKHTTIDEYRAKMCQITEYPQDQQDESTYKTYPFSGCKNKKKSKANFEKTNEPDLREIFSIPESTASMKKAKPRYATNKKNEKNSKLKIKRRYSKPKRKNGRVAHFRRKGVSEKSTVTKNTQEDTTKNHVLENILSRIKGRSNIEAITSSEEIEIVPENEVETSEELEVFGCNCGSITQSTTNEETENTEQTSLTVTNSRVLDEMFRKLLGETGSDSLDKLTDPSNKDESVTLIINVEDEVIAPPATNHSFFKMNPLSAAVQEMLAEVKLKMTEAYRTTTQQRDKTWVAEKMMKHVNRRTDTTVGPFLERGLFCTHCYKFNYPLAAEVSKLLNDKSQSETVCHDTTCPPSPEPTIPLNYNSNGNNIPVTDADYDQIMSRIYCNVTDSTHSTKDILQQLCENYKPSAPSTRKRYTTPSIRQSSFEIKLETSVANEDYDTQSTKQQQNDYSGSNQEKKVETTVQRKISRFTDRKEETSRRQSTTINDLTTRPLTQQSSTINVTKHSEINTNQVSQSDQTICFRISDFITERRKTTKLSVGTRPKTTEGDTTPYSQEGDTTKQPEDTAQYSKDTKHSEDTTTHPEDTTLSEDTTHSKDTTEQPEDITEQSEDTTAFYTKKNGDHISPRPCNCTPPHPSRQRTHKHPTKHDLLHSRTEEYVTDQPEEAENFETVIVAEESTKPDNEIKITRRPTRQKHRITTTRRIKHHKTETPHKEKEKPSKFKFYPPLCLYRTWLSPWAAVQIKQQPSHYNTKTNQLNKYNSNDNNNNEQDVITYPRQPYPLVWGMNHLNIRTTDSAITTLPSSVGHAKGVYVGAIIVGNKILPPGFYKLEDLRKLKNSRIPIPNIRGKKTIVNGGVGYSLKRVLPLKRSMSHDRGKNKRNITSTISNNRKGAVLYSIRKLPKFRIKRKIFEQLLDSMEDCTNMYVREVRSL